MPDREIEAITFDFWNTLVWEAPGQLVEGRLRAWSGLLEEAGTPVEFSRLAAAHDAAFAEYQAAWKANRQYVVADATSRMLAVLELDVPEDLRDALTSSFGKAGAATDLHLADGVEGCLRSLRAAGFALGIVCDIGLTPSPTLLGLLDRRGLLEHFGAWAFSDEVGVYKPEPGIFMVALDRLGTPPARAAHVGDRFRTDVAGARALGMVSVRYTGVYDDPDTGIDEADLVVADLAELPALMRRTSSPSP